MEQGSAILISRQAASQLLGVSVRMLDGLIKKGELRPRRVGEKRIMFERAELERFARGDHQSSGARGAENE